MLKIVKTDRTKFDSSILDSNVQEVFISSNQKDHILIPKNLAMLT